MINDDGTRPFFDNDYKGPIMVWPYHEAPQALKALSPHGGDEDWLAHVPYWFANTYISWIEGGNFGVCDVSRHEIADGSVVFIGAHS